MKRLLPVLAVLALCLGVMPVRAGNQNMREAVLFPGGDTDSTEQASRWIDISGASKVIIRTWSTHLAFGGNADSTKSDSLQSFNVLLSDSVAFIARDSAGTTVTAWSTVPKIVGTHGEPYPMCADSFVVVPSSVGDTTTVWTRHWGDPINKPLRGAQNGSGHITYVSPISQMTTTLTSDAVEPFGKRYLRIRCTPLRRNTANGTTSTQGLRVNGLRGFKMVAYVFTENK